MDRRQGLYRASHERDGCGFGLIVDLEGQASRSVVADGLQALARLTHRGAVSADGRSGDGCGLAMGFPQRFLQRAAREAGIELSPRFAAGLVFLPQKEDERAQVKQRVEAIIAQQKQVLVGWRKVSQETDKADVGPTAREFEPVIEQPFVAAG